MDVFYSNTSLKRLSKLEKEVGSNIVLAIEKLPYLENTDPTFANIQPYTYNLF